MQVSLHPGDYLVLNSSHKSCERYEISSSPIYQLGEFDFLESYYHKIKNPPLDNTRILRYETYVDNNKTYHQHIDVPSDPMYMWFPAKTCFHNISESINFTVVPYPYPCYHDFNENNQGTPDDGLRILCSQYIKTSKEYLYCTKNESNASDEKCCLHNHSTISSEEYIPFSLTAYRPYYTGINLTPSNFLKEGSLIEFNRTIPYMNDSTTSKEETFYLTCHHNQWEAGGILVGILVFMGLYLTLGYFCLIKLFSRAFFAH